MGGRAREGEEMLNNDTTETKNVCDARIVADCIRLRTHLAGLALPSTHPPIVGGYCLRRKITRAYIGRDVSLSKAAQLDHRSLITSDLSSTDAR